MNQRDCFSIFNFIWILVIEKTRLFFLKYILLIVLLQLSQFFYPLYSPHHCTPLPQAFPLSQFMSLGRTYKFFGFSISYTILNLLLSILWLPVLPLIPCTSPSPLITLHLISISVILFLLYLFA